MDAVTAVPPPVDGPVLSSYAPGRREREELQARLATTAGEPLELAATDRHPSAA